MTETDVKERILKGAEELFVKYGVRSISMDDIARHLIVSKKTLYQYYTDKEDLVTQTCQAHLQREKEEFEKLRASSKNAIEELAKISTSLRKEMVNMNPSLLFDLQKYHPKAWSLWQNFKENVIRQSVVRNLKQGIEEGYFRPELNPEILAGVRMCMVELAFNEQVFPPRKFSLADVQLEILDHFVYGIVTEKGRKLYQKYKSTTQQLTTP